MEENPSVYRGARLPVQGCGWAGASAFCERLTADEKEQLPPGWSYRLPNEKEWTALVAPSAGDKDQTRPAVLSPVDQLSADSRGFKGLFGNVWEWCLDHYNHKNQERMIRGGAWDFRMSRSELLEYRGLSPALVGRGNDGFRIFLVPDSRKDHSLPDAG